MFAQHFRWVFGARAKWPRVIFALGSLGAVLGGLIVMSTVAPRWKTVETDAKLANPIMRAPAASFVGTAQLLKDIDGSLGAFKQPSGDHEAD